MSKIETGRWSEQLRRMLGQKGQEMVASELSPEISPTIQLEGPAAEWDFLKGVRGAATGAETAAGVGFASTMRLRNPTNSGVIAQVNFCSWASNLNGSIAAARGTETTDLAVGIVGTTVLDQRWQTAVAAQTASLIASVTNLDAVGPVGRIFFRSRLLAFRTFELPFSVVLMPGTNLDWGYLSLNTELFANAFWNERALPALER